jgi:Protein of unknown function (DUF1579)
MTTSNHTQTPPKPAPPSPQTRRLDALVGNWTSHGQTVPGRAQPSIQITGTDTYHWLAGGHFLVHRVDVHVGTDKIDVIELIGPYDPAEQTYPMRAFDNHGNYTTMTARVDGDGVWTFTGPSQRATLTIAPDRTTMTARWERSDDHTTWHHWMDMTFTKTA